MFKRFCAVAFGAAIVLALTAVPAHADWTSKWSNGHKIESEDGSFKLKFGGRIQADYTFASSDEDLGDLEDGFEFRRARLFFSGTIYDRIEFKAQYDFVGGAEFKDVWIGIKNDWGKVQFGHFKEFFSLEELTSSKYLAFLERSLPVEAFSPSRNSGIGLSGNSGDTFNWGFGAFYDAGDFGESTNEDNVNVTGRIGFRPFFEDKGKRMLHLGLAVNSRDRGTGETFRFRARPEAHLSGRFVDTGSFEADSALILGAEVAGVFDRFWFSGEWIQNDVDAPAFGDPTFDGAYIQAGYYLTGDHRRFKSSAGAFDRQKPNSVWDGSGGTGAWEVVARYSTIDLTDGGIAGGEQDDYSLGLNWYPNPATRLMINYIRADVDSVGEADFFLVRWQVDF